MSPFSTFFRELRLHHRLRQTDLAAALGYDQTYLSALESGAKGPPSSKFVNKLSAVLTLNAGEEQELQEAVAASERKLTLRADSPTELYQLFKELRDSLYELGPDDIQLFRQMLKTCTRPNSWEPDRFQQLRRRARETISREGAAM